MDSCPRNSLVLIYSLSLRNRLSDELVNGATKSLAMVPVKKKFSENLEDYLTGSNISLSLLNTLYGTIFPRGNTDISGNLRDKNWGCFSHTSLSLLHLITNFTE